MTARRQSLNLIHHLADEQVDSSHQAELRSRYAPQKWSVIGSSGICLKLIYRARFPDLRRSQRSAGGVLGVASLAACTALSHVLSEGTAAEPWGPWVTTAVCMSSSLAA